MIITHTLSSLRRIDGGVPIAPGDQVTFVVKNYYSASGSTDRDMMSGYGIVLSVEHNGPLNEPIVRVLWSVEPTMFTEDVSDIWSPGHRYVLLQVTPLIKKDDFECSGSMMLRYSVTKVKPDYTSKILLDWDGTSFNAKEEEDE